MTEHPIARLVYGMSVCDSRNLRGRKWARVGCQFAHDLRCGVARSSSTIFASGPVRIVDNPPPVDDRYVGELFGLPIFEERDLPEDALVMVVTGNGSPGTMGPQDATAEIGQPPENYVGVWLSCETALAGGA